MISVEKGDITRITADVIVNAANSSLMGGGGVDGAIHRAGGPSILNECREIVKRQGGCPTGEAVITTAGNLPAKFVIHTVGPVWSGGNAREKELLAKCYSNSLALAEKNNCRTISFPSISTGAYRFPIDLAGEIAVRTVSDYLSGAHCIEKVILVSFDDENYYILTRELNRINQLKHKP